MSDKALEKCIENAQKLLQLPEAIEYRRSLKQYMKERNEYLSTLHPSDFKNDREFINTVIEEQAKKEVINSILIGIEINSEPEPKEVEDDKAE